MKNRVNWLDAFFMCAVILSTAFAVLALIVLAVIVVVNLIGAMLP